MTINYNIKLSKILDKNQVKSTILIIHDVSCTAYSSCFLLSIWQRRKIQQKYFDENKWCSLNIINKCNNKNTLEWIVNWLWYIIHFYHDILMHKVIRDR
jgi:hypothetical protein